MSALTASPPAEAGPAAAATREDKGFPGLAAAFAGAGLAMLPWLPVLASQLPASTRAWHWPVAWVGLDGLEALGLLSTGLLLRRRDARYRLTAAVTATLLVVDAWFDVLTSAPGRPQLIAMGMAACPELPLAAFCAVLAWRRFPGACRRA